MIPLPSGSTAAERETVIQFDDDRNTVIIWTAKPSVVRKLVKRGLNPTAESARKDGSIHGYEFHVPVSDFRWGFKSRRKGSFLPKEAR